MEREMIDITIKNLRSHGFDARFAKNREEAKILIGEHIIPGGTVAYGGSVTLRELEIATLIKEHKAKGLDHWSSSDLAERRVVDRAAFTSDVYCSSTNAITMDGKLLNIDGAGNRVAAMIYGPDKVIIVAGVNKIVKDLDAAYERLHKVACPQNARRLGQKTPCAVLNDCADCQGPERMCGITTIIERKPLMTDMIIIIVDENLGY